MTINKLNAKEFVDEWVAAWNAHDLDRILAHYTNDFEITTPMIKVAMDIDTGTLKGKENIREYWAAALQKMPDLHFELVDTTESIGSIAIYYHSVLGKMAIEVMFFNAENKVYKVLAHYN